MSTAAPASEMTIADALRYAVGLHQQGSLEGAATVYARILEAVPGHPDALHLLGMARHQMGQSDEGVSLIEQAIEIQPGYAGFFNTSATST